MISVPAIKAAAPDPFFRKRFAVTAEIKSAEAVSGANYRWLYSLQVVNMDGDIEDPTFSDLGDEVKGLNVREWGNDADSVQGQDPDDLPAGLDYGAVKGYVLCRNGGAMKPDDGSDAISILIFEADNPVEGVCG